MYIKNIYINIYIYTVYIKAHSISHLGMHIMKVCHLSLYTTS